MWLALRALFWTLVFPGVFGFYVPWRYFGLRDVRFDVSNPYQWPGMFCMDVGTILLLACIWSLRNGAEARCRRLIRRAISWSAACIVSSATRCISASR